MKSLNYKRKYLMRWESGYKYIPENPNKNEKICYVQMKGNHIYTINNNMDKLKLKDVEDDDDLCIYEPSPNYYINEEAEPIKARMITSITDILVL